MDRVGYLLFSLGFIATVIIVVTATPSKILEDSEIIIYKITITRMYVEKTMTLYSERRPQYSYEDRHLWVEYYPIGIEDSSEMMIAGKYSITIMPIKIKLKDLSEYGEKHE